MATPTTPRDSGKVWLTVLRKMGYRNVDDLIENLQVSAGSPNGTAPATGNKGKAMAWDSTNSDVYIWSTGTTWTKIVD